MANSTRLSNLSFGLLSVVAIGAGVGFGAGSGCLDDPVLPTCADFPLGTEGCPSPCDVYCEEVGLLCPDIFGSLAECNSACALEPPGGVAIPNGNLGDATGNTLSCRITAVLEARCLDARIDGSEACSGVSCDEYCTDVMSACPDSYPTRENCIQSCAVLPVGTPGAQENSLACRQGFATAAVLEPTPANCNAASFGGGGVCGADVCDLYCDLQLTNCVGQNQVYADRGECMTVCGLLNTEGSFDDWLFATEIDTVQCRLYHAGPPAAAAPGVHCPHTRVYNDQHCGITPMQNPQDQDWPCRTFCDVTTRNCPGLYADAGACLADCRTFPEITGLGAGEIPAIYPVSSTVCPQ